MEFSFEYYDWLHPLNEPGIIIAVCIFGSILSIFPLALIRWILKKIGLGIIADWKVLDDIMITLFICGFLSLIIIMPLTFVMDGEETDGIRVMLIWIVLFLSTFVFYSTHKDSLSKWAGDITDIKVAKRKRSSKKQ